MRDEIFEWVAHYPRKPEAYLTNKFEGSHAGKIMSKVVPGAVALSLGRDQPYLIRGSAGKGKWTYTPWVAVLDPTVTTTTEEGFYVVYLMSYGCDRLYLTLNQGCTTLSQSINPGPAREILAQRAQTMRSRIDGAARRLSYDAMDLNFTGWRARAYASGHVIGAVYDTDKLPSEQQLLDDLTESLDLYRLLKQRGGWELDDAIIADAEAAGFSGELTQAKIYRQHRAIEREPSHARAVRKVQGTCCKACRLDMVDVYGTFAAGMIDVHHLTPLATLADGAIVKLNPMNDFAVLCPNCHRAIHRSDDPSDVPALERAIKIQSSSQTIG